MKLNEDDFTSSADLFARVFDNVLGIEPSDASKHIKQKRIKLLTTLSMVLLP